MAGVSFFGSSCLRGPRQNSPCRFQETHGPLGNTFFVFSPAQNTGPPGPSLQKQAHEMWMPETKHVTQSVGTLNHASTWDIASHNWGDFQFLDDSLPPQPLPNPHPTPPPPNPQDPKPGRVSSKRPLRGPPSWTLLRRVFSPSVEAVAGWKEVPGVQVVPYTPKN